jgi:cytochrome c oxidase assembly protein subunit 15
MRLRHYWAAGTLACTVFLIFWGGLVTSTESALAVPDWPLSYGMWMPPLVGGVFYEHIHRMIAAFVGFLTLVLAVWTARDEARRGVRRLAWVALAAVCIQGGLGGLTVLLLTPLPISATHACLAQTFLCLLVALTYVTSREWTAAGAPAEDTGGLRSAAVLTTAGIFVQLILGAIMRHADAGLAIPDFPTALGRIVPPLDDPRVAIHFSHRLGALAVLLLVARLAVRALRSTDRRLRGPAGVLVLLSLSQATLGALTVISGKMVYVTTSHVALGAVLLATSAFLTLRSFRLLRPRTPAVAAESALARPA